MNCPVCGGLMRKITPLIFQGEGVDTYSCVTDGCDTMLNHKPNALKETEFQAVFSVKCVDGSLDTAEQQDAFLKDMLLTYLAVNPGKALYATVSLCTD